MTHKWTGRWAVKMTAATLANYGTVCHLCLLPGSTTADHLTSRREGGSDDLANLRPAHHLCNSTRQDRPITPELLDYFRTDDWRNRIGGPTIVLDQRAWFTASAQ